MARMDSRGDFHTETRRHGGGDRGAGVGGNRAALFTPTRRGFSPWMKDDKLAAPRPMLHNSRLMSKFVKGVLYEESIQNSGVRIQNGCSHICEQAGRIRRGGYSHGDAEDAEKRGGDSALRDVAVLPGCGAELHSAVPPNCIRQALRTRHGLRISNPRYSRVKLCATEPPHLAGQD